MPALFVTATGTDIGKTYVTAGLARCLIARGRKVAILKPVASGFDPQDVARSDPALLLQAIGRPVNAETIAAIAPWRFEAPLSPDMAAARGGNQSIDFAALTAFCRAAAARAEDVLLIEGIGGLMVPLTASATVLDLIAALEIASILVTGTYVGTLSHTLTALAACVARGIPPRALVVNQTAGSPATGDETAASLRNFCEMAPTVLLARGNGMVNTSGFEKLADFVL